MKHVLFVNACINRERSRTVRLAGKLISRLGECEVEELVLEDLKLPSIDSGFVNERTELTRKGDFDSPVFVYANKMASADIVIIASPFWENCFNSYTKTFLEYAGAVGVAFRYSESGMPIGMCRGDAFYYVTTRGGPIPDEADPGCAVMQMCAQTYGFKKFGIVSASGLDIITNDAEAIMKDAIASIPSKI